MRRQPLREYSQLWTLARRARRRGDAHAAARWQRLAEGELRLGRMADDVEFYSLAGALYGLQQRVDELRAAADEAGRALAEEQAKSR